VVRIVVLLSKYFCLPDLNTQDFDGDSIGQTVTQTFMATNGAKDMITWTVKDPHDFSNEEADVAEAVGKSKAWAAITIRNGATSSLNNAISSADASYNGTAAITAFGNQARNDNA
jgi:hypothetical protein